MGQHCGDTITQRLDRDILSSKVPIQKEPTAGQVADRYFPSKNEEGVLLMEERGLSSARGRKWISSEIQYN